MHSAPPTPFHMDSSLSFIKAQTKAKTRPVDRQSQSLWTHRYDFSAGRVWFLRSFTETFTSRVVPPRFFSPRTTRRLFSLHAHFMLTAVQIFDLQARDRRFI